MKKIIMTGCTGLLCMAPMVNADTIFGVYAGAYAWQSAFSGDINSTDVNSIIDIEEDLGFDDESNTVFYLAIEHPVPVLPNIKVQQTELKMSGSNALTRSITFDDTSFTASTDVDSEVDFSHTDITLYYELLDNWVSLDFGLTARKFDGSIDIESTSDSASVDVSATIPMLYAKAQFDLPLTGLSVSVDGNFVGYSGNSLTDFNASINYELSFGLGLAAGYRSFALELDDVDDIDSDMNIDGAYAAITFHF